MTDRKHERLPRRFRVEYRSESSLLVAYTVNLSQGGTFLECDLLPEIGSTMELELALPHRSLKLQGTVAWLRESADEQGPRGFGVRFEESESLGATIDELVARFDGINTAALCHEPRDQRALLRAIRSTVRNAEVAFADSAAVAQSILSDELDLVFVDMDDDPDGGAKTLEACKAADIPSIALAGDDTLRSRAETAGAEEILDNPPIAGDLREAIVRRLSQPRRTRAQQD
jgi:uncharacterized protein (TIGR02266 family)